VILLFSKYYELTCAICCGIFVCDMCHLCTNVAFYHESICVTW